MNKRGFTLLELVLALAIAGMTGVLTAHFLWPQITVYQNFSVKTDANYLCDSLFAVLERELRFGKDYLVVGDGRLSYLIVEEDETETEYYCGTEFDGDMLPFIPEGCVLRVSYKTNPAGTSLTISISVYQNGAGGAAEFVYGQEVTILSLYS